MSYVALATDRFDDVVAFYGEHLRFRVVDSWDRPNARGLRFDLDGMRLEIFDNRREQQPLSLGEPADRVHIVIEVENIDDARRRIGIEAPPVQSTSWGARLFQVRDPDGVPVTFLQWTGEADRQQKITGRVASGVGRGKHFTHVDWARQQFIDKLQIDPYPGTVNLTIEARDSLSVWDRVKGTQGTRIDNPGNGPNACNARCYPVRIAGQVDAAIVLSEVSNYSADQVEIIAPVSIRDVLDVKDGDTLILEVKTS